MRNIFLAVAAFLALTAPSEASARDTFKITVPSADGSPTTRTVTHTLLPSDGVQGVCPATLYYGGMAEDSVRTFNCDGTGTYIDGENRGTFKWYYAISPTDPSQLFIKTFSEWSMGPADTNNPAVAVYITYQGGNLDGETYVSVIGVVDGQVQMSPLYASKR